MFEILTPQKNSARLVNSPRTRYLTPPCVLIAHSGVTECVSSFPNTLEKSPTADGPILKERKYRRDGGKRGSGEPADHPEVGRAV